MNKGSVSVFQCTLCHNTDNLSSFPFSLFPSPNNPQKYNPSNYTSIARPRQGSGSQKLHSARFGQQALLLQREKEQAPEMQAWEEVVPGKGIKCEVSVCQIPHLAMFSSINAYWRWDENTLKSVSLPKNQEGSLSKKTCGLWDFRFH